MKAETPTLTLELDEETSECSEVDTSEKADVIMEEASKETHNLTDTDSSHKDVDYYNQKAEGLKKFLHGITYQLGLLTLIAYRAQKAEGKFENELYLISEAAGFGKFDDLVVDYGNRITFLQAKHSAEQADYEKKDFLAAPNASENQASLAKYFDSWMLLKNSEYCKAKKSQFIFFTNKGVKEGSNFLEETKISKDDLLFEDLEQKTFKFKSEEDSRKEFVEAIYKHSQHIERDCSEFSNNKPMQYIKEARKFLEKELLNQKPSADSIKIDGKSKLDNETAAIIKLVQEGKIKKDILGPDADELNWLEGKIEFGGKYKVSHKDYKDFVKVYEKAYKQCLSDSSKLKIHVEKAKTFLEKKIKKPNFKISSKTKLSDEATVIIKLALQNAEIRNELCKGNKGLEKLLTEDLAKISIEKYIDFSTVFPWLEQTKQGKELVNQFLDNPNYG